MNGTNVRCIISPVSMQLLTTIQVAVNNTLDLQTCLVPSFPVAADSSQERMVAHFSAYATCFNMRVFELSSLRPITAADSGPHSPPEASPGLLELRPEQHTCILVFRTSTKFHLPLPVDDASCAFQYRQSARKLQCVRIHAKHDSPLCAKQNLIFVCLGRLYSQGMRCGSVLGRRRSLVQTDAFYSGTIRMQ